MAYLLSTPSRQKTTVASVDFVAKYSSGAVADFHRSSLTTEAMSISILKAKKILSSKRFASLKINTKIVKYISRKGGIRKRRREDEA